MRAILSTATAVATVILLTACGGEDAAAPIPAATSEVAGPMENVAEAGATNVAFVLGCGAPFTRDRIVGTHAKAFNPVIKCDDQAELGGVAVLSAKAVR